MRIVPNLVLAAAFCALPAAAQGGRDNRMADMMKNTQPGERHKQLSGLEGTWDVVVRFKYGPGPEREGKSTATSKWILGGRFLQQEYTSESGQVTLQFVGYDNQKKKFVLIKMDNNDTGILSTEGTGTDDGKVITCVGDRIDPMTGQSAKLRIVTTITDKDHFTVEWYQPGPDGKEQKVVTLTHQRRRSIA